MTTQPGANTASLNALNSEGHELLRLIAEVAPRVSVPVYMLMGLIALLVMPHVGWQWPLAWVLMMMGVVTLRTRLLLWLPHLHQPDKTRLRYAAVIFSLNGAGLSLIMLAFPKVPLIVQTVLTLYQVALCASTLNAVAGYRPIYLPYTLVMLSPVLMAWASTTGDHIHWQENLIFAGLTVVFWLVLLAQAKGTYAVFQQGYRLRQERYELNKRLAAALEQESAANVAKTRFLASASHDLRQPIQALSLFSGSLQRRTLDPQTSAIAAQIDRAVTTLVSQLDSLLDISRLDAGVVGTHIDNIALRPLIRQLEDEFGPLAQSRGVSLCFVCSDDVQLRTDGQLLLRILRNLLSNALKYTEQGTVTLQVEDLQMKFRISVADTGPGIPLEEQAHVFEEFYQLNNPERDRSKGLGLGLSIVRRLAALLDLPLSLSSEPGKGTTLSLVIPAADGRPATQQLGQSRPASSAQRVRLLVIDDEEAMRLGMKLLLESMGHEVVTASSSREALSQSIGTPPDLALVDFRLRGQDNGLDAIAALRKLWPGLPVVLVTGDTAPDRLRAAHDANVPMLHKPVTPEILHDTIIKLLSRKHQLPYEDPEQPLART